MEKTGFEGIGDMMRQNIEQSRKAMESCLDVFKKNSSSGGDSELTKKMESYTEKNIAASSEFADRLTKAKDFHDFWRIQTEFMQAQWKAFHEQATDLGETMSKSATNVLKGPSS